MLLIIILCCWNNHYHPVPAEKCFYSIDHVSGSHWPQELKNYVHAYHALHYLGTSDIRMMHVSLALVTNCS